MAAVLLLFIFGVLPSLILGGFILRCNGIAPMVAAFGMPSLIVPTAGPVGAVPGIANPGAAAAGMAPTAAPASLVLPLGRPRPGVVGATNLVAAADCPGVDGAGESGDDDKTEAGIAMIEPKLVSEEEIGDRWSTVDFSSSLFSRPICVDAD